MSLTSSDLDRLQDIEGCMYTGYAQTRFGLQLLHGTWESQQI